MTKNERKHLDSSWLGQLALPTQPLPTTPLLSTQSSLKGPRLATRWHSIPVAPFAIQKLSLFISLQTPSIIKFFLDLPCIFHHFHFSIFDSGTWRPPAQDSGMTFGDILAKPTQHEEKCLPSNLMLPQLYYTHF